MSLASIYDNDACITQSSSELEDSMPLGLLKTLSNI